MAKKKATTNTVTTANPGCMARVQKYGRYGVVMFGACCLISFVLSFLAPPTDESAIPTVLLLPTSTVVDTDTPMTSTHTVIPATLTSVPTDTLLATIDVESTTAFIATIAVANYRASETVVAQAQIALQPSVTQQPAISTNTLVPTNDPLVLTVAALETALELTQNAPTHTHIPPTATRAVVTPAAPLFPVSVAQVAQHAMRVQVMCE